MKCEWCGMDYPDGEWDYYYIKVFDETHLICSDCYKHLFKIRCEKDKEGYNDFVDRVGLF